VIECEPARERSSIGYNTVSEQDLKDAASRRAQFGHSRRDSEMIVAR